MAAIIRYGRCTNKARCSLALNYETIYVPLDGRCPECGQLLEVENVSHRRLKLLPLIVVLALLGVGGYYAKVKYIDRPVTPMGEKNATPSPDNPIVGPNASPTGDLNNPANGQVSEGAVDRPKFGLDNAANAKARTDVLARIDLMPHLTEAQKAKLTSSVDRAHGMGCIFIIPFEAGKKALGPRESDIMVKGFQSAAIQKLMEDPTLVFVILGYSDKQGGDQQSEKASIERSQNVLSVMKDRCGVQNVMYAVGMGSSQIAGAGQAAKNRLVEIWAVYP